MEATEKLELGDLSREVSSWVVDWFSSRGKIRSRTQEILAVDYLQSGLLTSLEIVDLVASLEDHFGIQFSEADMQDPRFSTIGGLVELVVAARNGSAQTQGAANQVALNREDSNQQPLDQPSKVG